jgi:hypothetical protein
MKNIYLAARFGRREELRQYRKTIEALGYHCTSRWLDVREGEPNDNGTNTIKPEAARYYATADFTDLLVSDTILCFTEASDSIYGRGGRHIEAGMALMLARWKPDPTVIVIGPCENIYYTLANGHYATFDEVVAWWTRARQENGEGLERSL